LYSKEKREKKKAFFSAASARSQNARGHKIAWVWKGQNVRNVESQAGKNVLRRQNFMPNNLAAERACAGYDLYAGSYLCFVFLSYFFF